VSPWISFVGVLHEDKLERRVRWACPSVRDRI